MKQLFLILLVVLCLGSIILVGCSQQTPASKLTTASTPASTSASKPTSPPASSAPAQVITLKAGSSSPSTAPPIWTFNWWCQEVEKRSEGRIKFEYLMGGSAFKAGEGLDAVKNGIVDVANLPNTYWPDRLPLSNISYVVPFGPTDVAMMQPLATTMYTNQAVLKEIESNNVKFLFPVALDDYAIVSKQPIKTIDDLKGKKVGCVGNEMPKWLSAIGAVPVTMKAPNKYQALQTGVTQADAFGFTSIGSFKLYEVAPNVCFPHLGSVIGQLVVMNRDSWNKLPPDLQKLMLDTAKDANTANINRVHETIQTATSAMEKAGVKINEWPVDESARWANSLPDIPENWVKEEEAKGIPAKEVMNFYLDNAKKLGFEFVREWTVQ